MFQVIYVTCIQYSACVCEITLICILRDTNYKMQMLCVILSTGHIGVTPGMVGNTSGGMARNSTYVWDGHCRTKKIFLVAVV